jgi:ectoine hydroxylase-related dioxygenase (phytanoyl-CoA dioxygenase family)
MNAVKHEFWVTPVWEIQTDFNNSALLSELNNCKSSDGSSFNLWNYSSPRISSLKDLIFSTVKECVGIEPVIMRGWINRQKPMESLPIHDHGVTVLACVYYVNAPDNCGDLLLVDPRGSHNWDIAVENNVIGVKHKRIKPVSGKIVLFPAYLLHMVEINRSTETRICVATNVSSTNVSSQRKEK